MALITADRVMESATTTGTGAFTLAGAHTGYRAFSAVCSTNDTIYYCIEALDGNGNPSGDWEVGLGTYSGTNTLTRTTVHFSSNSNNAVNFSAGTKRVFSSATATYLNTAYRAGGTDVALADGGTGASLSDPNADRIMFWDDSAGAVDWLTPGTGLSISGTTLNGSAGGYEAGPPSVPDISGWTSWNLGTSTIASTTHTHIFSPQNGAIGRGYYTAVPSAPFDIYMRYHQTNWPSGDASPQNWSGILLRNNSGGASLICGYNGTSSPRHELGRFASGGTTAASAFALFSEHYGRPHWVRVNVTSTTVTQYISFNGYDWLSIGTETISTHISAVTHYGFASYENSTNPGALFVSYLSTTAPS